MKIKRLPCLAVLLLLVSSGAVAQEVPHVFAGARLETCEGPPIDNGVLVVHRGKIVAVGRAADVAIPAGAVKFDATGRTIMPGLVCSHSHIGSVSGGDSSGPFVPLAVRWCGCSQGI